MDLGRRAKIFSPFDALKGFKDAIDQVDRQSAAGTDTEKTE